MEYFEAGMRLWHEGQKMASLQYFKEIADGGDARASGVLGELYERCKMLEDARRAYEVAARSEDSNAEFRMGQLLNLKGEKEEAEKYFELAGAHGNWRGYVQIAKNSEFMDSIIGTTKAKEYFEKAAAIGSGEAWYELGKYLISREEFLEGLDWLEKAARKNNQAANGYLARLSKDFDDMPSYRAFLEKSDWPTKFDLLHAEGFFNYEEDIPDN